MLLDPYQIHPQCPALTTASSIILTGVTEVVGFCSILGIAALFAPRLANGLT